MTEKGTPSETPRTDAIESRLEDVAFHPEHPESDPWQFCFGGALEHARDLERENSRLGNTYASLCGARGRAEALARELEKKTAALEQAIKFLYDLVDSEEFAEDIVHACHLTASDLRAAAGEPPTEPPPGACE